MLNSSTCLKRLVRNEPIHKGINGNNQKCQTAEKGLTNSSFRIQKHLEENFSILVIVERFDEKSNFPFQGRKLPEDRSPATRLGHKKISPNVDSNQHTFGVGTTKQELHASGHVLPASSAINFKPFVDSRMEHPQNYLQEKTPPDLLLEPKNCP